MISGQCIGRFASGLARLAQFVNSSLFRAQRPSRKRASPLAKRVGFAVAGVLGVSGMLAMHNPDAPVGAVLDGEMKIAGLDSSVTITRDKLSMPTVHSDGRDDAVFAMGFLHGQERYFQMDVARRLAAGELAEFAPQLLDFDREYRPYRFRHVAQQVLSRLDENQQQILAAYARGVNAGVEHLPHTPLEYGMLNLQPQPWKAEDSLLVLFAMYDFLQMEATFEKSLGALHEAVPEAIFEFLTPIATRSDVPLLLEGDAVNDWTPSDVPGPDVLDLRRHAWVDDATLQGVLSDPPPALGSNNWAVAGAKTTDGRAILANDPHLQLSAPGTWYRAEMHWQEDGEQQMAVGLTLPGVPGVAIGSNTHLAWGITNTMGDFQDLIVVEVHPEDDTRYRTPDGYEPFEIVTERIHVRGRGWEDVKLKRTRWGIVTDTDHHGRPLVLKWTALQPKLVNLDMINLGTATTLEQGVEIAKHSGGPSMNVLLADDDGRIAWTVSGYFPKRFGFDGRVPMSWADGDVGWDGVFDPASNPSVIDPEDGVLLTANNRTVSIDRARTLGGIWVAGERANRINQMLRQKKRFTEDDLFAMQLDTRVAIFDSYRDLALKAIDRAQRDDELLEEAREVLSAWNGTADADQPAMRLLERFRNLLRARVLGPLTLPAREVDAGFSYRWFMDEEPLQRLLTEQPAHLLSSRFGSWDELIERTLDDTLRFLAADDPAAIRQPWGEVNQALIQHPLAIGMPALGGQLNLPEAPQPGHRYAVRVASRSFGASARLVVSPGRETQGICHTPAGQSGHPKSPHYTAGHEYWLHGRPLPLRPGKPRYTLQLMPTAEADGTARHLGGDEAEAANSR